MIVDTDKLRCDKCRHWRFDTHRINGPQNANGDCVLFAPLDVWRKDEMVEIYPQTYDDDLCNGYEEKGK